MTSLVKVNDYVVKPIVGGSDEDKRPIYGAALIPHLSCNIYVLGQTGSGKTLAVKVAIEACALPGKTHLMIFSSTVHHDKVWQAIIKYLDKHGISYSIFDTLEDPKTRENYIETWFDMQKEEAESKEDIQNHTKNRIIGSAIPEEPKAKKKRAKYQAPKWMWVFDDFSHEIKNKWVQTLLRKCRHYGGSKVIISSQYFKDIDPGVRGQIHIWCLFPNIPEKLLEEICAHHGVPFDKFMAKYKIATYGKGHDFLYFDGKVKPPEFRRNFTHLIR